MALSDTSHYPFTVKVTHHDAKRFGLRTIETTWVQDSPNGECPAGTVVTRVVTGQLAKPSGRILSETIVRP